MFIKSHGVKISIEYFPGRLLIWLWTFQLLYLKFFTTIIYMQRAHAFQTFDIGICLVNMLFFSWGVIKDLNAIKMSYSFETKSLRMKNMIFPFTGGHDMGK